MNISEYWKEYRKIEETLQDEVWLTSLDNPRRGWVGGCVVEVKRSAAARALTEETHRLATPEEVEEHKLQQQRRADRQLADARAAEGLRQITLAPYKRGQK